MAIKVLVRGLARLYSSCHGGSMIILYRDLRQKSKSSGKIIALSTRLPEAILMKGLPPRSPGAICKVKYCTVTQLCIRIFITLSWLCIEIVHIKNIREDMDTRIPYNGIISVIYSQSNFH